tara:strand:+ start:5594 stop:5920 length:327 start_codon:yes stop_codon:yes gene_type:complete
MFHHIVLFKFKRGYDKGIHRRMKRFCRDVMKDVPGAVSCFYGENFCEKYTAKHFSKGMSQGFTHVFVSVHENAKAHDKYQESKTHEGIVEPLAKVTKDYQVCDYITRD